MYYLLILSILKSCHIRFFQLGTGIVQSYCKTIFVFGRDFKHRIHHNGFYDGTQTASSQLVFNSFVYNILNTASSKSASHHPFSNSLTYCLIDFRFHQNGTMPCGQRIQMVQYRQTTDDFGNQANDFEILRSNMLHIILFLSMAPYCALRP